MVKMVLDTPVENYKVTFDTKLFGLMIVRFFLIPSL